MEKEDPLQKIEREESEKKSSGGLKTVMIIMIIVAVALAAALVYVTASKSKLVNELNQEKDDLTTQVESLQNDYKGLSSDYDSINSQLDSSREEIAQLVTKVKKTDATNRTKIRQYEKELGTLRSIMRGYISQIDSLNTLNHKLTIEAANARAAADSSQVANKQLTQQVQDLSVRVSAGAVLKARGLKMEGLTSSGKISDKSSRIVRLLVSLSLVENELAERGGVTVFVRVTDPNGNLVSNGSGMTFSFGGQTLDASASREVDYEGSELDLGIYVNNVPSYSKGVYTVHAYTTQASLGSAELLLR